MTLPEKIVFFQSWDSRATSNNIVPDQILFLFFQCKNFTYIILGKEKLLYQCNLIKLRKSTQTIFFTLILTLGYLWTTRKRALRSKSLRRITAFMSRASIWSVISCRCRWWKRNSLMSYYCSYNDVILFFFSSSSSSWSSYPFRMLEILLNIVSLSNDERNTSIDVVLNQSRRFFSHDILRLPGLLLPSIFPWSKSCSNP